MKVVLLILVGGILFYEWPRDQLQRLRFDARKVLENFIAACAVALLLLSVAFPADQKVITALSGVTNSALSYLLFIGKTIGTNSVFWLGLLSIYLLATVLRRSRVRIVIFGAMLSAGASGLLTTILKVSLMRARPDTGHGELSFFNLQGYLASKGDFLSFPSGDVAIVAGAAYFLMLIVKPLPLRALLFTLPLLTAASRISLGRHWPSDTLASMLLAMFAAYLVSGFLSEHKHVDASTDAKEQGKLSLAYPPGV